MKTNPQSGARPDPALEHTTDTTQEHAPSPETRPGRSLNPTNPDAVTCRRCAGTGESHAATPEEPVACDACNGEGVTYPDSAEQVFVTGHGVMTAETAVKYDPAEGNRAQRRAREAGIRDGLADLLEEHPSPSRRFSTLLRALRETLRSLPRHTEDLTEAGEARLAHQQQMISVVAAELRLCLLSSNITIADMTVADRLLDTLESVSWVFDQCLAEDDQHARICAIEAGAAAHDKLVEIGIGMGGV